ncbi:hypothetical protein [Saccharothrix syringae]|uniref:Extracellular solute-binding protein n=1 Tax=Saccharothrix syringae TaxID=103733 RepID=A0A5Q0GUB8_SACSY|nr:hypothetical protein [Saccharothrix syringae]QFZ17686.1 hypothetical protein EKG83_09480 [Saccharothrix syringae]
MVATSTRAEPQFTIADPWAAFRQKRFLLPFGTSVVTALVGALLLVLSGTAWLPFRDVTVVRVMMASKRDFFEDAEVRRIMQSHGIRVQVTPIASRELVYRDDLDDYDFVLPSGQSVANVVRERRRGKVINTYRPFFSPIVLGTYREYAKALEAAGVAKRQDNGGGLYYDLSLPRFVDLVEAGTTWSKLAEEAPLSEGLPRNGNRIIAQTPDPCLAYSGATFLGMVAFARNGNQAPADEESAARLAKEIKPLFDIEGQHGDDLGPKYVTPEGRSFATIVVIYEHQYLAHQFRWIDGTGKPDEDRVLLYPEEQHETAPELLAFTPAGNRVGELVTQDPALRRRAVELGFRVYGTQASPAGSELTAHLVRRGLPVPGSGVGDTEAWLPDLPLLERMIEDVGGCR